MDRKVKLLPRAVKELEALPSPIQDQLINKLELLSEYPFMGPAMFDAFEGYRALLVAKNRYRVIYRVVSDDTVEIAYIRRCSRQTHLRAIRTKE